MAWTTRSGYVCRMMEGAPQHWVRRPLMALAILTFEYLTITFAFDAYFMLKRAGGWEALGWMGLFGPALIAFGTSLWVLGRDQLLSAFAKAASTTLGPASLVRRLIFHFACFAVFFVLTALIFGTAHPPAGHPGVWISLWVLAGALNAASLVPIAFGGLRVKPLLQELATPLLFSGLLALIAWGAGLAALGLWTPLGYLTLHAVASTLGAIITPIHFDPSNAEIGTTDFWVEVAPVCSGYEGIGLIIVFLTAYLVVFRERFRFPRALLLLPIAIALVWMLNVVRIVALILIGHAGFGDIAIGGFHSKAGWLFFSAVALGSVWASQRIPWFARDPDARQGKAVNPAGPFLLPLLAMIATALVTGLFADEVDYLYPLRVVAALAVLAWYRRDYLDGLRARLGGRKLISWESLAIGFVVYVVWIGLSALAPYQPEAPPEGIFELAAPLTAVWIAGRALGSIIVVPIVEELAFRGFLLRRLVGRDFNRVPYEGWHWPAALLSSLAFAAVHQQWIGGFIAGLLYAYAQKHRGLLSDAIVAHAVSNLLISIQVLAFGHWSLW